MSYFEIEYRSFELLPQRHQLSTTSHFTIEEVFETIEKANVYTSKSHFTIDPIFNRNFVNTFHLQNLPNQRQHVH